MTEHYLATPISQFAVITSSAVDRGFEHRWINPKTIKLVFVASSLRMQYWGEKLGLFGIGIMCQEWSDMSTLFQWISTIQIQLGVLVRTKRTSLSHCKLTFIAIIKLKNCWIGVKHQSLTHNSCIFTMKEYNYYSSVIIKIFSYYYNGGPPSGYSTMS